MSLLQTDIDKESSSLFLALQNIDIDQLEGKNIKDVLPYLTRLLLSPSFVKRQQLLRMLYPIKKMNDVIQLLLSRNLETHDTALPSSSTSFESCCGVDKLKMVAIEYIKLQEKTRQSTFSQHLSPKLIQSDLFDNPIYVEDVSRCLCILLMKSSPILAINILDMAEALLHVKFGSTYIIRIVFNMPDRCQEVCQSLITYGERQDEGANFNEVSEQRAKTLRLLCLMNPVIAFTVRSVTLQMCKMPSLTIMITLDHLIQTYDKYNSFANDKDSSSGSTDRMDDTTEETQEELVKAYEELEDCYENAIAFITGILLGVDEGARVWFAQYTKSAQQKRIDQGHFSVLTNFRSQILAYMNRLFSTFLNDEYIDSQQANETIKSSSSTKTKINFTKEMNRKLIRATATLRLFCALRGIGSLKLNPEESEILLRLVTCKPLANQTSVNFATTGVCTLLVCSTMINNQKDEKRAAEWLKWLIRESNYSDHKYSSHGKCSISELLLLIAIHFQNNQTNQIAELVCTTLGMKLQIKASVSKCKSLFVQEVFNDQMVAEHAVRVPVTKGLNDTIGEFLAVHCIQQLLESRSFSKHQVPIKDWIYRQICESKKPIHHILPKLIEAYVNSVIISSSVHGHCGTNQPISEEEIRRVFKTQLYSINRKEVEGIRKEIKPSTGHAKVNGKKKTIKRERNMEEKPMEVCDDKVGGDGDKKVDSPVIVDVEVAQVLLLYYLVLYEDVRLKKNPDLSNMERSKLVCYNPNFMMDIPVFYLLQLVRDNQHSFAAILPDLLKLVTSQYPQLCSIQHWITIEYSEPYYSETKGTTSREVEEISKLLNSRPQDSSSNFEQKWSSKLIKSNLFEQLNKGLELVEDDPDPLVKTLGLILVLPREEVWPYVDIFIENLSKIIRLKISDSAEYKKLILITTKLWWKFNTVFPRKLWVMTVNALKRPQNVRLGLDVKPVEYCWDELALDPLIVLRCDSRVFRCESTLNIVLHILSAFLAASRRCLQDQINEKPGRQKELNLEELKTTLILAQTSAAIQILLEFCLPSADEQEALNKRESDIELNSNEVLLLERFDASVDCICQHLHQVFIADTNLAKLVHFQTYPSELLATTSNKIPSMHICLDFIPELLSQPDLSKQVFVVELTSHLCEKYAITKSLNVAKLCFNVAYTLLQLLPSERRSLFFIPVLPALLKICKVFPILREDADIILTQINQITLAHMASTSSRLSLGSAKPFEGLEKMTWREVKNLMKSLSLHEALYLCITFARLHMDLIKKENGKPTNILVEHPPQTYNTIFAYGNHVI